jgi:predicted nucleic acid-binding Zn ribbon protein
VTGDGELDGLPDDPLSLAREIADSYRGSGSVPAPRRRRKPSVRRKGRDDPMPIADVVGELVRQQGWDERLTTQRVFSDWAGVVGPDVAEHSRVESMADGIVQIRADSTAWTKQLQLLAPALVKRLNAELGQGSVLRVEIRGPQAPSWKPGRRVVRNGRGPRDTYG